MVSILHIVVRTTVKQLADVCPSVSDLSLHLNDQLVLLLRPTLLRHRRRNVVKPALSALVVRAASDPNLLCGSVRDLLSDLLPLLFAILAHTRDEQRIFLLRPSLLHRLWVSSRFVHAWSSSCSSNLEALDWGIL